MNHQRPNSHDTQHDDIAAAHKCNPEGTRAVCGAYTYSKFILNSQVAQQTLNIPHLRDDRLNALLLCVVVVEAKVTRATDKENDFHFHPANEFSRQNKLS